MADDLDIESDYEHVTTYRERRHDQEDLYHVEDALERLKTFRNPGKAELYTDVYTVAGGFREEKTGERGVPPAVAASREDLLMAYLTAQPTMSLQWVARFYDEDEAVIQQYINHIRKRAAKERQNDEEITDE